MSRINVTLDKNEVSNILDELSDSCFVGTPVRHL
jgi:hypothetical protein